MKWIKNWRSKRRIEQNKEIANEVIRQLDNKRGWEKFLPPVVVRDTVYLVTEDGSIYAMKYDDYSNMEMIVQIRHGR